MTGQVTLVRGDCRLVLPRLDEDPRIAVVSDPPWGCGVDTDFKRFSHCGFRAANRTHQAIQGDDAPFDPSFCLRFRKCILWGANHFFGRLPGGGMLVWLKKREGNEGKFLSDAEVAWVRGSKGVWCFAHRWAGLDRQSERGQKTWMPAQKPIALMQWCIERLKLRKGDTVLDPHMGSGSTGVAAVQMGLKFIGIEIDKERFGIAGRRIAEAQDAARK